MTEPVTIVIVPRDRFSSLPACVDSIIANTDVPFRLAILDLGYPRKLLSQVEQRASEVPLNIFPGGRTIPTLAFQRCLPNIDTPYIAWVDNDTFVGPGWMSALLERARQGARV